MILGKSMILPFSIMEPRQVVYAGSKYAKAYPV